jgi:hypothetical protein
MTAAGVLLRQAGQSSAEVQRLRQGAAGGLLSHQTLPLHAEGTPVRGVHRPPAAARCTRANFGALVRTPAAPAVLYRQIYGGYQAQLANPT